MENQSTHKSTRSVHILPHKKATVDAAAACNHLEEDYHMRGSAAGQKSPAGMVQKGHMTAEMSLVWYKKTLKE